MVKNSKNNRRYMMAIDPSINTMGLAIFNIGKKKLVYYALMKPQNKKVNEFEKSLSLYKQLRIIRKKYSTELTVCEIPVHWERDGFVARESGSIQKMMIIIGMIYTFRDVKIVPPHGWKGQLPKPVVHRRLTKIYGDKVPPDLDHNIVDAIGIGHWHLFGRV